MLNHKATILLFFAMMLYVSASAKPLGIADTKQVIIIVSDSSVKCTDTICMQVAYPATDSLIQKHHSAKENKKIKIVSALFAFPFPFGFMGAHRVMLGTNPWVPVVYVATLGGCFGLLPLIDFFVITFSKDIEQYENNPHVFMWVK